MAYNHGDRDQREQRSRYEAQQRRDRQREHEARDSGGGGGGDRGFFERASDEVSSWFGDDEAERRREMDERSGGERGDGRRDSHGRDENRRPYGTQQDQGSRNRDDGPRRPYSGRPPERNEPPRRPDVDREQDGYRPMTGDYGRASAERFEREQGSNRTSAGAGATAAHDRHYSEWRQRQIDAIDRDYDDYRREHQSKFESDFSNWRSTRQSKREILGSIKEHMQVFGSDDQPVGTVDKVRGDRIVLTKSDSPDGQHHSINLAMIDRVEGDRVLLDKSAEDAKAAFGSEERDRALNERDNQGESGPHILDRSFSGTY